MSDLPRWLAALYRAKADIETACDKIGRLDAENDALRAEVERLKAERDDADERAQWQSGAMAAAEADAAAAREQVRKLREALTEIDSRCRSIRDFYDRNGPTWTGKDGHEYADMSEHVDFADEIGEAARAALQGDG